MHLRWASTSMIPASAALAFGCLGCQAEYRSDSSQLDSLWTNGAYEKAAHIAYRDAREESPHRKNRVVYFLEAGRAAQVAGDYPSSIEAFDHAFVDTFPYLDESPEATVSEAIVTTVGNDTMSIYRGTPNDRIMLHAFNSLNFMAMGDMPTARIELNRAMLWQDDAHHRYARAIELANERNTESVDKASGEWGDDDDNDWSSDSAGVMHGNTSRILSQHYNDLPDNAAYANYGNPFASHLDGIFRLTVRDYNGDLPAARTGLRNVAAMVPTLVPVVGDDIMHASTSDEVQPPTTWVYFMNGQSPDKKEVRISMPLALSGGFTMPTLALPKLVENTDMVPWLDVRTDEAGSSRTHLLTNTADVARWQFKERLPIIISQEAIRATGKAVAAYFATQFASDQQNLAASLLALGTVMYQVGSAQADLRCWHTLPAEIQVARIPTPPSGRVYLSTPDGRALGEANIAGHEHNILVVSMPSNAAMSPSLMPIQLTGERTPWVASFDLHAVPEDGTSQDAIMDAEVLVADANRAPAQVSLESINPIDETTVMVADTPIANEPMHISPPLDVPTSPEEVIAIELVDADALPVHDTLDSSIATSEPSQALAFAAVDEPNDTTRQEPSPPVASPPVPNYRYPIKGVKLTWGQDMQWKPDVDQLLDARVTLQPTPSGYMAHYGDGAPLVTSPSALLKDRPVWMHQDALVTMSDAVSSALSESGYMGTRVYPALATPDQFGHNTLHFVVFLPIDSLDATTRWPEGLAAVEHPTLPRISGDGVAAHQHHREANSPPVFKHRERLTAVAIDIDALDESTHALSQARALADPTVDRTASTQSLHEQLLTSHPTATAPLMPNSSSAFQRRVPSGPRSVKTITATWGRSMDWYPDLNAMLDVPVRLQADRTGYRAHSGSGPVVVTTPGLLVARQPAALHADAMHAMGRVLQRKLEANGFIGTTVHPACTSPDARGFVELHLVVFMPMEDSAADNIWPAQLTPVPLPVAPKATAPAQKAPAQ